ncbi:hypothetical protein MOD91_18360 [Bacillus haynesii]|uniref:hypothetical protein n=1 Tax=Bacillus haynesii TaxID=1925021 RepID=UPI002281FB69|nr:hypothetical protein [Bacillus haynesii]MCY8048487.1 hypothetical protein [Bacillus haynesii]MCY8668825.1 hypothetical protein [Bacillus haynesii]
MKIKFQGDMTLDEFSKLIADVVKDFLDKVEADGSSVRVADPIFQTSFRIAGQDDAVYMTTEHGEMLQVEAEVEDGKIKGTADNQENPTNDRRLWSYEKIMNEAPQEVPTKEITSDFDQTQIEFKKEFVINSSLKQKVYKILGTDEELVRYFNTDKNVLVAEEVVSTKQPEGDEE